MKVLQINTVFQNGGSTGRIVYDLKNTSEKQGVESYVAYGYNTGNTIDNHVMEMQSPIMRKISILKCRIWPRHGFYSAKETKKLIEFIKDISPDIIHLHNIHNHYINVEILFSYIKRSNIPIVWTLHDCWPFTGWCAYFDYVGCDKWKTECNHCPNKHEYPYTWFFDLSRSNYNKKEVIFNGVNNLTIVTPSSWLKGIVKESFLQDYPVTVINNGVDMSVFHPVKSNVREEYGIGNRKMILAVAGGLSPRKGREFLLKLPTLLRDDEVLVLVGLQKGQESLLPQTDKLVGIQRTKTSDELVGLYSEADVFVNPTLEDNFPTTNIESLACGTPVVTFRTGGSVEVIAPETGLIAEKGDMNGLLTAIRIVLAKGKAHYTNACRKKAEKDYDKDVQYTKYIDLYKTLH